MSFLCICKAYVKFCIECIVLNSCVHGKQTTVLQLNKTKSQTSKTGNLVIISRLYFKSKEFIL